MLHVCLKQCFYLQCVVEVTEIFHIAREIFSCNYITMQKLSDKYNLGDTDFVHYIGVLLSMMYMYV